MLSSSSVYCLSINVRQVFLWPFAFLTLPILSGWPCQACGPSWYLHSLTLLSPCLHSDHLSVIRTYDLFLNACVNLHWFIGPRLDCGKWESSPNYWVSNDWIHIVLWFSLAMLVWYTLPLVNGCHSNSTFFFFFTTMSQKATRNLKTISEHVPSLPGYWSYTIGNDKQAGHIRCSFLLTLRGPDMGLAKPPQIN